MTGQRHDAVHDTARAAGHVRHGRLDALAGHGGRDGGARARRNAFDAAAATGFTLQVVEPHLNGPGGDLPAVFWSAERGEALVLCAQGVAPAAATIEQYRAEGLELVPGTGLLAACVPGAFGGWLTLLSLSSAPGASLTCSTG